ncbi:hypothetical protein BGW41_006580, partial [Actinomortierella wolfii]
SIIVTVMNKEPIYKGKDIFECPDEMVIHPFFMDNQDNIALWNLQTFLDLYPSDLQLYIDGIKEIKSYKSVAASIRNFCVRQIHFLESPTGLAYARALQDTEFVQTASASSESSSLLTSTLSTIAANDDKGEEIYIPEVSATVNDAANIFGTSLIARISNEVTLKEVHLPILAQILAPLHESFTKANLDLEFLQQEIELRLAEIALRERHEGWRTRDENMDRMVSRQVYNIIHFL